MMQYNRPGDFPRNYGVDDDENGPTPAAAIEPTVIPAAAAAPMTTAGATPIPSTVAPAAAAPAPAAPAPATAAPTGKPAAFASWAFSCSILVTWKIGRAHV